MRDVVLEPRSIGGASLDSGTSGSGTGRRRARPARGTGRRSRAAATPPSCSGSTTKPASGTNAIKPRPAVARIDATVASTTNSSTTPKIAGHLAQVAPHERERQPHALRTLDVLDRDHHLRHQVDEVHDRRARRSATLEAVNAASGPAEQDAGVAGQCVAAEHRSEVGHRRAARRRAAGRARAGRSAATSAGSRRGTARCR